MSFSNKKATYVYFLSFLFIHSAWMPNVYAMNFFSSLLGSSSNAKPDDKPKPTSEAIKALVKIKNKNMTGEKIKKILTEKGSSDEEIKEFLDLIDSIDDLQKESFKQKENENDHSRKDSDDFERIKASVGWIKMARDLENEFAKQNNQNSDQNETSSPINTPNNDKENNQNEPSSPINTSNNDEENNQNEPSSPINTSNNDEENNQNSDQNETSSPINTSNNDEENNQNETSPPIDTHSNSSESENETDSSDGTTTEERSIINNSLTFDFESDNRNNNGALQPRSSLAKYYTLSEDSNGKKPSQRGTSKRVFLDKMLWWAVVAVLSYLIQYYARSKYNILKRKKKKGSSSQ